MGDKIFPMDEKYRAKHYPKGYLAAMVKDAKGAGVALIICGAVLALIGAGILKMVISVATEGDFDISENVGVVVFLVIVGLVFLIPGILIIRYGIKRNRLGEDGWIRENVEASGYQESEIRDFANQALEDGTLVLKLGTSGIRGLLTRDYIAFQNIIKIEDIAGVYFVQTSYTVNVNGKTRRMYNKNIKIVSKHNTVSGSEAKEESVRQIANLLMQKNPAIDTQDFRLLSEDEFEKMLEERKKQGAYGVPF